MALPDGQGQEAQPQPPAEGDAPATAGGTGAAGPASSLPDAASVPARDPDAAQAPQAGKAAAEKATAQSPPAQTGAPTPEASAAEAPAKKTPDPEKLAAAKAAAAARAAAVAPAGDKPARPAREAEPKGPPRNPPPPGGISDVLAAAVPGVQLKAYLVPDMKGESVAVEVSRDDLTAVMTAARDDERLDLQYLRSLSGVDWQEEGLEVAYHLWSFTQEHKLTVKTRVPAEDARVPSVSSIWPAANWHEREARDMFGIAFEGHPELVPLLLPEDMTDHFPLRKDNPLQEIEEWQGENLRDGASDGDEE